MAGWLMGQFADCLNGLKGEWEISQVSLTYFVLSLKPLLRAGEELVHVKMVRMKLRVKK